MKRFDQWSDPNRNYIRRPGVYAILPKKSGILATFQAGIHNEFQLPGGGVDPGEQPIIALHREVMEETGWRISNPKMFTQFKRYVYMPDYDLWAEKICKIYVATPVRKICDPLEVDHEPLVLSVHDAIRTLASTGDCDAVQQFFKGM